LLKLIIFYVCAYNFYNMIYDCLKKIEVNHFNIIKELLKRLRQMYFIQWQTDLRHPKYVVTKFTRLIQI
ncbi:hypothetical protein DEM28_25520, partial [Enterobacter mori]